MLVLKTYGLYILGTVVTLATNALLFGNYEASVGVAALVVAIYYINNKTEDGAC